MTEPTKSQRVGILFLSGIFGLIALMVLLDTLGGWPTFGIFLLLWANNLTYAVSRDKPGCNRCHE